MKSPVKFGKYYLLDRISVGGMAEVFKAKSFGEAGFERLVAIKRILPSIAEDKEFIAMFIDEAKLAVELTHPNIAQIFELAKVGESYFSALEYVSGKDLRAVFERSRKLNQHVPVPMACYVVMKLCEGLDYAHNKKDKSGRALELVHRDVSPQNILVSYDGDVKLIDFGIAKAASKNSTTMAGILKGKFGYMSPEQVRGLQVDRRSDIFAVGICLYELLTMERLFVGESDFSTLEKVRNVEIMPPSTYNKKIPDELEAIVLKALAKHPEDRYRTAMDLHDDLQSFMYTSGNFFARKDLSVLMHKLFGDEISKEAARDEEFRRFDSRKANDLEELEGTAMIQPPPPSTGAARSAPPLPPGVAPRAAPPPPAPGPRAPKGTVLGMGNGPAAPPKGQPIGGAAAIASASVASGAAMAVASPRSALPVPPAVVPPPPAAMASSPEPMEIDWDEEEMATQVFDRPEAIAKVLTPPPPPAAGRSHTQVGPSGVPVLPAIPGVPSLPAARPPTSTSLGIAPPPATSLPAANGLTFPGPPPSLVPAVSAPQAAVQPPSVPPRSAALAVAPSAALSSPQGRDAYRIGEGPRPSVRPSESARPRPVDHRKKDSTSMVVLAGLGVVAVAAAVVLGLKLTRGDATGGLLITTNVGGVTVLVDGQPQMGNGQRFVVQDLHADRQHTITVQKPGFASFQQDVSVREGATIPMEVVLDPEPSAVAVPPIAETTQVLAAAAPPTVPGESAPTPTALPNVPTQQLAPNPSPVPTPVPTPVPSSVPAPVPSAPPVVARASNPETPPTNRVAVHRAPRPVRHTNPTPQFTPQRPEPPATATATRPSTGGANGTLLISTRPASTCTIPGHGGSFGTPRRLSLPPGSYSITCINDELNARSRFNVTISPGQTADLRNRPLE